MGNVNIPPCNNIVCSQFYSDHEFVRKLRSLMSGTEIRCAVWWLSRRREYVCLNAEVCEWSLWPPNLRTKMFSTQHSWNKGHWIHRFRAWLFWKLVYLYLYNPHLTGTSIVGPFLKLLTHHDLTNGSNPKNPVLNTVKYIWKTDCWLVYSYLICVHVTEIDNDAMLKSHPAGVVRMLIMDGIRRSVTMTFSSRHSTSRLS